MCLRKNSNNRGTKRSHPGDNRMASSLYQSGNKGSVGFILPLLITGSLYKLIVVEQCVCCCALGWISLWDCKFNSCHAIWSCRLVIFVIESQEINKIWQLDTFWAIKFLLNFLLHPWDSQILSQILSLIKNTNSQKKQKREAIFNISVCHNNILNWHLPLI